MAEIDTIRSVLFKLLDFVETLFIIVGHLVLSAVIFFTIWLFDISANDILTVYKNNPVSQSIESATAFLIFMSGLSGLAIIKIYIKILRSIYAKIAGKLLVEAATSQKA